MNIGGSVIDRSALDIPNLDRFLPGWGATMIQYHRLVQRGFFRLTASLDFKGVLKVGQSEKPAIFKSGLRVTSQGLPNV